MNTTTVNETQKLQLDAYALQHVWPAFAQWLLTDPQEGVLKHMDHMDAEIAIEPLSDLLEQVIAGRILDRWSWGRVGEELDLVIEDIEEGTPNRWAVRAAWYVAYAGEMHHDSRLVASAAWYAAKIPGTPGIARQAERLHELLEDQLLEDRLSQGKARVACELYLTASKAQRARLPGLFVPHTDHERAVLARAIVAGRDPFMLPVSEIHGLEVVALYAVDGIKTTGDIHQLRIGIAALLIIDDLLEFRDLRDIRDNLYAAARGASIDLEPIVREFGEMAHTETQVQLMDLAYLI